QVAVLLGLGVEDADPEIGRVPPDGHRLAVAEHDVLAERGEASREAPEAVLEAGDREEPEPRDGIVGVLLEPPERAPRRERRPPVAEHRRPLAEDARVARQIRREHAGRTETEHGGRHPQHDAYPPERRRVTAAYPSIGRARHDISPLD